MVIEDEAEAIDFVNARDTPLALYVFTEDQASRDNIFHKTRSGGFVHNDTLVLFGLPGLPFGGHGASGMGHCHGKASFDGFSHMRSSANIPTGIDGAMAQRYPPYAHL